MSLLRNLFYVGWTGLILSTVIKNEHVNLHLPCRTDTIALRIFYFFEKIYISISKLNLTAQFFAYIKPNMLAKV